MLEQVGDGNYCTALYSGYRGVAGPDFESHNAPDRLRCSSSARAQYSRDRVTVAAARLPLTAPASACLQLLMSLNMSCLAEPEGSALARPRLNMAQQLQTLYTASGQRTRTVSRGHPVHSF